MNMTPKPGWFSRLAWMRLFRPDGKGRIVVAGGSEPPEVVEFDEIVCDRCNADAGAEREDGTEGKIYFTGADSLCEACGLEAEARDLERVRDTLRSRGWPEPDLAALSEQELREICENWMIEKMPGITPDQIAERLQWDVGDILFYAGRILEEANVHDMAKIVFGAREKLRP